MHLPSWIFIKRGFIYGPRYWFDRRYRKRIKVRRHDQRRKQKYPGYKSYLYNVRKRIFGNRSHGFCAHCRYRFPVSELTLDHIIKISEGGKNEKSNIQVLCRPCHEAKDFAPALPPIEHKNLLFQEAFERCGILQEPGRTR